MTRVPCFRLLLTGPAALMLVLALADGTAWAQDHRLVPVGDPVYTYLQRLQRRGHLLELPPTALPYTVGAIHEAMDQVDRGRLTPQEARWLDRITEAVPRRPAEPDEMVVGGHLGGGVALSNTRRLDPRRPLGDDLFVFPNGQLHVYLAHKAVILQAGPGFDLYYDRDPDGLDAVLRIYTRSDNSYAGVRGRFAEAYLGRWAQHWAPAGDAALLVSANPRTYDHLALRFGGRRLAVRSLLGELDSSTGDGRFTGTAGADSVRSGSTRRYMAAHRLDWRPSPRLTVSLLESALYSGPNSGLSLKYLNPGTPFVLAVDNRPKNDENNGLLGLLVWAYQRPWTLYTQLMVDDVDVLNADEPLALAWTGSVNYALAAADVGVAAEVVTARAYNAPQAEGQYTYLQRGLATQFNDYVHLTASAALFADALVPGLTVTPRLHWLAQGQADLRGPYPGDDAATLLGGTAERIVRAALQMGYQHDAHWWLRLDVGVNRHTNAGFVEGATDTRLAAQFDFGFRLPLVRTTSL